MLLTFTNWATAQKAGRNVDWKSSSDSKSYWAIQVVAVNLKIHRN